MTAAFAYDLNTTTRTLQSADSAGEDLAIAWAIIRLVEQAPGTLEERGLLEASRLHLRELSRELQLAEEDFPRLLQAAFPPDEGPRRLEAVDPPAPA